MTTYTKGKRRLLVGILLSASFISVLNQFLLITAFPQIMSDFEINATEVQWLTTVFMLAIAVLVPITAYLIDRFTSRALLLAAVFSFSSAHLLPRSRQTLVRFSSEGFFKAPVQA
nr:MFS transporter [Geomicrobium sp. JCM 19039]